MNIVVTGGAGFIGSAVIHRLHATTDWRIANVDTLTYAANPASLLRFPRCLLRSEYEIFAGIILIALLR